MTAARNKLLCLAVWWQKLQMPMKPRKEYPGRMPRLISFDLDDTLIGFQLQTPRETRRLPWFLRPWKHEPIRAGTTALMEWLTANEWGIAIYTTSFRSERDIRRLLRVHGVVPDLVVNQTTHERVLQQAGIDRGPTKLPSLFGIGLHVDDSDGVAAEGREWGFDVVVVRPDDLHWAEAVKKAARKGRLSANRVPDSGDSGDRKKVVT